MYTAWQHGASSLARYVACASISLPIYQPILYPFHYIICDCPIYLHIRIVTYIQCIPCFFPSFNSFSQSGSPCIHCAQAPWVVFSLALALSLSLSPALPPSQCFRVRALLLGYFRCRISIQSWCLQFNLTTLGREFLGVTAHCKARQTTPWTADHCYLNHPKISKDPQGQG